MNVAGSTSVEPQVANVRQVFRLLVLYRWLSVVPVLLALAAGEWSRGPYLGLVGAVALNLAVTLGGGLLNDALQRRPWLLLVDMGLCAGLIWLSGGWDSPFYLYSLGPILAAAFFFRWRGALLTAAGMAALFVPGGLLPLARGGSFPDLTVQLVGYFLIAGTFGYATTLLAGLQASHADLDRVHRDLAVIHNLTVALVDADDQTVTAWLSRGRTESNRLACDLPHTARLPLTLESGESARCLLDGQARPGTAAGGRHLAATEPLSTSLGDRPYHLVPMLLPSFAVGALEQALRGVSLEAGPVRAKVAEFYRSLPVQSPGVGIEDWVSAIMALKGQSPLR